jgi:hypothetical protein
MAEMEKEQKIEAQKKLYDLWVADNNMLNKKLSQLFVVNSILLAILTLPSKSEMQISVLYGTSLIGGIFSLLWFFSIKRTLAFRQYYKDQLTKMIIYVEKTATPEGEDSIGQQVERKEITCDEDTIPCLLPSEHYQKEKWSLFARLNSGTTSFISLGSFVVWILVFLYNMLIVNDLVPKD